MRKITQIIGTTAKIDKAGNTYYKTLAILDEQDEAWGWSKHPHEYHVGDEVMYGFHSKYDEAKMMKPKLDNNNAT